MEHACFRYLVMIVSASSPFVFPPFLTINTDRRYSLGRSDKDRYILHTDSQYCHLDIIHTAAYNVQQYSTLPTATSAAVTSTASCYLTKPPAVLRHPFPSRHTVQTIRLLQSPAKMESAKMEQTHTARRRRDLRLHRVLLRLAVRGDPGLYCVSA